jgi:osomolarity two-component system, sensor histidine kinase SLN1
MRIPIREQLGLLVLFCSLFALMVLAVATWTQSHGFIINIRLSALSLTASLKSAQISAALLLFQTSVQSISTRIMIQSALQRYNNGEYLQTRKSSITLIQHLPTSTCF